MPFEVGNTYGKGRPRKDNPDRMTALELVKRGVSDEDIVRIIERQVGKAMRGSAESAKLLLAYRLGKPEEVVRMEHDGGVQISVTYATRPLAGQEPGEEATCKDYLQVQSEGGGGGTPDTSVGDDGYEGSDGDTGGVNKPLSDDALEDPFAPAGIA